MKQLLEEFFGYYKKQIGIDELLKRLHIKREHVGIMLDNLYELEKEGKIFFDKNHTYMHVPDEFCFYYGILKKSNSNQFYIKSKNGNIFIIKNVRNAKEGDAVFVSRVDGKSQHPKQFYGDVIRVARREKVSRCSNYIVKGTLKKDGNYFYVTVDDNRIYISRDCMNTAFVGDLVNVQIKNGFGSVVEVLKRRKTQHVFRLVKVDNGLKWIPISSSYGYYDLDKNKFKEGDVVIAEVGGDKLKFIEKIDGNHSTLDDINALVIEYGFANKFSSEVMDEARRIKADISLDDYKDRVDLRELETFTIDPVDAKDLDDAISLECVSDGYYLYVHAANPSHYIKINSCIFKEALKRSFSVYPSNGVIPMLPDCLSSEICSLNEHGDKLALTCKMKLDFDGNLIDYDIFKSIIRNDKQMNYDAVNEFFESLDDSHPYASFGDTLLIMRDLANILQKKKTMRGSISFLNEEKQFVLNDDGEPIGICEKQRGDSQMIIENFMLLANETVSRFAFYVGLPYIYRNHEKPTVQKKMNLKYHLGQRGYIIQRVGNVDHPEFLQRILNSLLKGKNKEEKRVICEVFLKSMTRAFYDVSNIGHYGLALDCYGTVTSPARKVSDFLNHMVIEEFLDCGIESSKLDYYREFINDCCEYISSKQKDADLLEQEMDSLMMSRYADNFLNEEVKAKIVFVNKYGIYVKDTHGLMGLIPMKKGMKVNRYGVLYQGCDYRVDDCVSVILKERKSNELIFEFGDSMGKGLVKKKEIK